MKTYVEKLESQEGKSKYFLPSCRGIKKGREGNKVNATFLLDKPISYGVARRSLLEAVKMTKIKTDEADFGLHSCRIGALKVGKELGSRLAKSLGYQVLETAGNRQTACNLEASRTKAAATAGEKKQEKISRKRSKEVERQGKAKKKSEEKVKRERLLLRVKRTGTGAEDYQALPPRQ